MSICIHCVLDQFSIRKLGPGRDRSCFLELCFIKSSTLCIWTIYSCVEAFLMFVCFRLGLACLSVQMCYLCTCSHFNKWHSRYFARIDYPQEMINGPDSNFIFTIPVCNLIRSRVPLIWAARMNRWRAVTIDEWIDKYMDLGYNGRLLFSVLMRVSGKRQRALSSPFQLSGARRWKWEKAGCWVMSTERRAVCVTGDRLFRRVRMLTVSLTVACCFSACSFASSSCFCKAAWRDFISSLSSESEERNSPLAHLSHRPGTQWPS